MWGFKYFFNQEGYLNEEVGVEIQGTEKESIRITSRVHDNEVNVFLSKKEALELASHLNRMINELN